MAKEKLFNADELDLLKKPIPKFEKIQPSFITILRAHSETNLSNLLVYFFKGEDHPQLKEIFLTSLVDCINLDSKRENILGDDNFLYELFDDGFESIEIHNEYPTKLGRIDILIVKEHKNQSESAAIIIENKLYHELNNDLDDYFYTVCNDYNLLPKNVAVVLLSLKEIHSESPMYMKNAQVLHKNLMKAVAGDVAKNINVLNDRSAGLLVTEYFRHINDLYLKSSSYGNEKSLDYYSESRIAVNSIAGKMQKFQIENLAEFSEEEKKHLIENKSQIDLIVKLHEDVIKFSDDCFNHYLKITDRNVQGKDYFRGRGLAFDAIRYKLNFQEHLHSDAPIKFGVWLNGAVVKEHLIKLDSKEIQAELSALKVSIANASNNNWFQIHEEDLEIDSSLLETILREKIDGEWGKFEEAIANTIRKSLIDKFNQEVIGFLEVEGSFTSKIDSTNSSINYSFSASEGFVQYSIKHSPPDLIEVILYVNTDFWENVSKVLKAKKEFIVFTVVQSYRIPELKDESLGSSQVNYDALLKRSYRVKSVDEIPALLEAEKINWAEVEKQIMEIVKTEQEV
jgi:hypothetical protein